MRKNLGGLYGVKIEVLEKEGWWACPAYGGFFIDTEMGTHYLDSETGDVRLVSSSEIEALTLFSGLAQPEVITPSLDDDENV